MTLDRLFAAAIIAAATTVPAVAQQAADDLAPGVGAGNVLSAQLAIKPPAGPGCPTTAEMQGWVFTDFGGSVQMMIVRKGSVPGTPFQVATVPAANGQHVATFQQDIDVITPVDDEYRLLVGGGDGVVSNWVPLSYPC